MLSSGRDGSALYRQAARPFFHRYSLPHPDPATQGRGQRISLPCPRFFADRGGEVGVRPSHRLAIEPPATSFAEAVVAVGLVEANTENIARQPPLGRGGAGLRRRGRGGRGGGCLVQPSMIGISAPRRARPGPAREGRGALSTRHSPIRERFARYQRRPGAEDRGFVADSLGRRGSPTETGGF